MYIKGKSLYLNLKLINLCLMVVHRSSENCMYHLFICSLDITHARSQTHACRLRHSKHGCTQGSTCMQIPKIKLNCGQIVVTVPCFKACADLEIRVRESSTSWKISAFFLHHLILREVVFSSQVRVGLSVPVYQLKPIAIMIFMMGVGG